MYDPEANYQRPESESASCDHRPRESMPTTSPAYCPRCGDQLTPYTWLALLKVVFCSKCVDLHEQACLDELHALSGLRWQTFFQMHYGLLWFAPEREVYRGKTLREVAARRFLSIKTACDPEQGVLLTALPSHSSPNQWT